MERHNACPALQLADFVSPPAVCHAARHHIVPQSGKPPIHTHDFCEITWAESGRVTHWLDGVAVEMGPGDLAFIQPEFQHGFCAATTAPAVIINVAFPTAWMRDFQARYFATKTGEGWDRASANAICHLTRERFAAMTQAFDEFLAGPNDRLHLDCLVLRCLSLSCGGMCSRDASQRPSPPDWLESALSAFRRQQTLPPGVKRFCTLAGRCPEHVNRATRRALDQTLTDVLNGIRLQQAARDLLATDREISQIAWDCGFRNLGHFYKLFKTAHGASPRRYRLLAGRLTSGSTR